MIEISAYFDRLYELLKHDDLRKALFVVLPTTAALGFLGGRKFTPRPPPAPPSEPYPEDPDPKATALQEIIDRARRAVAMDGPGLWLACEPQFPANYHVIKSSIPIFTVANLKGGVGKTTIATGLAAHFVNPRGGIGPEKRTRALDRLGLPRVTFFDGAHDAEPHPANRTSFTRNATLIRCVYGR